MKSSDLEGAVGADVSFVLHGVKELLGFQSCSPSSKVTRKFMVVRRRVAVVPLVGGAVLVEGGDLVVVAIELGYDLGSIHVADEELDVVVVEVEDLAFGDVAALDVVALQAVLDDYVRTFKLGVELVRLVFSRVKAEEDELTGAVDGLGSTL